MTQLLHSSAHDRPGFLINGVPAWADPLAVAGRAAEPVLDLWDQLLHVDLTTPAENAHGEPLPPAARRWLLHATPLGCPLSRRALLKMTGHIKIGRWLPFRAIQLIAPPVGFVWVARAGWGPICVAGFDSYGNADGRMSWSLAGRIPMMSADGADVSRSAADRVALDATWLPSSFVAARWEQGETTDSAVAEMTVGDEQAHVEIRVADDGRLTSVRMQRWANPTKKAWGRYACGGLIDQERTFDNITIASRVRVGYGIGTDQWATGEFFRAQITDAVFAP